VRGAFLGFKTGKRNAHEGQARIQIEGVKEKKETSFYMGKRVAYVYKAKNTKQNSRFRCVWGKIIQAHGNNGIVRAKFHKNLPPRAFGAMVRVMLYPNRTV
jgi:large subunit ribosomal protein L35Ae